MTCCSDPNTIGLEVQPISDNITISDLNSFNWQTSQTVSEDYLRTDESVNLILGEIVSDEIFLNNIGSFYTQILLTQNNIDLGNNPIVDSVVLSYIGFKLPDASVVNETFSGLLKSNPKTRFT